MAEFNALNLILTAEYVGGGAVRAMQKDIAGMVGETSGLSRLGAGFSALGTVMIGASIAMATGLGAAVKVAMEYDDAVNRIIAVGGLQVNSVLTAKDAHDKLTASLINNRTELQAFNAEVASAGTTYGIKLADIAKGAYFLFSALPALKISSGQALGYNIINDLAAYTRASGPAGAGGVTYDQAAQDIPRLMSSYNTPISNWGGSMGVLTFLENQAHLTQAQLVQSMSKFLPAAGVLGMNFSDSATLMAALSSTGVTGSRAGTEASSALFKLFSGTGSTQGALKSLGLDPKQFFGKDGNLIPADQLMGAIYGKLGGMNKMDQTNALHGLIGMVGDRAFGPLFASGMDKYNNLLTKEKNVGVYGGGKTAELYMMGVAGSMMNSPVAKLHSMLAAFELLGIVVGNKLTPFVMKAEDALTRLALKLSEIVGKSNNFHDFIKNLFDSFFGGGKKGGVDFGSIGAHMMGSGGGGMLLTVLGTLLGGGLAAKGLGGGLGFLGKIDSGVMGKTGLSLGSLALNAIFGGKPGMGPLQNLFGGREGGMLGGIFGGARGLSGLLDSKMPAAHFGGFGIGNLLGAMFPNVAYTMRQADIFRGTSLGPSALSRVGQLGHDFAYDFGKMGRGATGAISGAAGGAKNFLFGGGIQDGIGAMRGALERASINLPIYGAVIAEGLKRHLVGGFQSIGPAIKLAGGHLQEFGAKGIMGALHGIRDLGGVIPKLVTGGFGLLRTGVVQLIPTLLGFGAAAIPIIAVVLLIAGAIAIGILLFTKFRTQTMAALRPLFTEMMGVFFAIKAMVLEAIQSIVKVWNEMWPQIRPAMNELLKAVSQMGPVWTVLGTIIKMVVGLILGLIVGLVTGFIKALPSIIGFFTGIIQIVTGVAKFFVDIFQGKWSKLPGDIGMIFGGVYKAVTSAFGAILTFIGGFVTGFLGFINKMTGGALTALANTVGKWIDAGKNLLLGLVQGIANNAGAVKDALTNAIGGGIEWAKHILGIHSPSAVFSYFGHMSMEGFSQGFKNNPSGKEAMAALLPGGKLQLGGGGKLAINSLHVENLHLPKDAFPAQGAQPQRSAAEEYLFTRSIQQSREQTTGMYDRRSNFDQNYRYASQYTQ